MTLAIISFGGLALNTGDYKAFFQYSHSIPPLDIASIPRGGGFSKITALSYTPDYRLPVLQVQIESNWSTAYPALMAAFDTSAAVKAIVVSDVGGANERYIMAAVQSVTQIPGSGAYQYAALLVVDGEQYWRGITPATDSWSITASEQTTAVVNSGNLDAYPTYTVTPTAVKSGGVVWKMRLAIGYRGPTAYDQLPIRISQQTAVMLSGDVLDDETNLAVYVDGKEVRRWISDWGAADTGVWVNLDFGPGLLGTYSGFNDTADTAMTTGDDVDNIILSSNITDWPSVGTVRVGNAVFDYEGVDRAYKKLLNVRRTDGFALAACAVGATVVAIQHTVEVVYGHGVTAATSFPEDTYPDGTIVPYDDRKPIIDLDASTNISWVYANAFNEVFEDDQAKFMPRTARWFEFTPTANVEPLLGLPPSASNVCGVIGLLIDAPRRHNQKGKWTLKIPYELGALTYLALGQLLRPDDFNGSSLEIWQARLLAASPNYEQVLVSFGVPLTPEGDPVEGNFTEDYSGTLGGFRATAGKELTLDFTGRGRLQINVSELTLGFVFYSLIHYGEAAEAYNLNGVLENLTTGESITLQYPMVLDEPLVINTADYTVTYNDSNQYQAIKRNSFRLPWLRLAPGSNTLKYTETGVTGLDIDIEFEERYY